MKDKSQKKKDMDALRADLEQAGTVFLNGYEKITVQQDNELRAAVRKAGGKYRVVKNRIAEKAATELPAAELLKGLKGMRSVAYTDGDPVALAKALSDYAKTNASFTFHAGFVEGRVIDLDGVKALANLPSKEELYAKILWLINSPAQRLVTAMSGVGRNVAVVIDQGVKENKFSA